MTFIFHILGIYSSQLIIIFRWVGTTNQFCSFTRRLDAMTFPSEWPSENDLDTQPYHARTSCHGQLRFDFQAFVLMSQVGWFKSLRAKHVGIYSLCLLATVLMSNSATAPKKWPDADQFSDSVPTCLPDWIPHSRCVLKHPSHGHSKFESIRSHTSSRLLTFFLFLDGMHLWSMSDHGPPRAGSHGKPQATAGRRARWVAGLLESAAGGVEGNYLWVSLTEQQIPVIIV